MHEDSLSPTSLFQGYNAVLGIGKSTAVTGPPPNNLGATSSSQCTICRTMKEVSDSIDVNTSFSASYAGLGKVDAKADYLHKMKLTTNSLSIVVRAKQIIKTESMTSARLVDGIKPGPNFDLNNFVAVYGDSFVSEIAYGGEYIATYVFYCENEEEQTDIATSLEITDGTGSLEVNAELSMKLKHAESRTTVRSELFQLKTGVTGVADSKGEDIADFALNFSKLHLNVPVVCDFNCKGYEELPGLASIFQEVVDVREYFCGVDISSGLNNKLSKLLEIQNEIDEIQSIYKFYGGHADRQLIARRAANQSDINAIRKQLNVHRRDPTKAFEEPSLPSLENGAPRLMFKPFKDISGSNTGEAFDDIPNIRAYLRKKTRIRSITIEDTFYIKRFSTVYYHHISTDDVVSEKKSHGADGGHVKPPLMMDEGVFISEMSGFQADNRGDPSIHMIRFTDSDGNVMEGGMTAEELFHWPLAKGRFVLGFFGRTNDGGIRALGVHIAEFADAKWSGNMS